jgi:hypothetical protein
MRLTVPRLTAAAAVCVLALTLAPAPALASTPLPAPTNVQAVHVADTSADLWWLRDGASAQDVVERQVNGVWSEYARGLYGVLALTALTPATTYTFRVYSLPVDGLGYTTSARSAPVSFTTLSGPDALPPSKPPTPTFSSITTTVVDVYWREATDNVQVTGYYLQQLIGGAWTTIRTVGPGGRFQTVGGLTPGTSYSFAVIAFDARGNVSARSDAGTVTTLAATTTLTCLAQVITYTTGFQASVTIINTTPLATNGWTIRFTLPADVSTGSAFNGLLTRSGSTGTITPLAWSAVIGPGGQLTVGFSGWGTAPITSPSGFTLNGVACTSV